MGLLRQLIRADSSNPPGDERQAVAVLARALRAAGIEPLILARDERRPNLVARIAGRGEAPPLLLYGHSDVVPAREADWTHAPFSGAVVDGDVWGRGALDMKGGVAMLTTAFVQAARSESPPAGDLLLVVNSDEEAGGGHGAGFLVREHSDLLRNVRHALSEFGGYSHHVAGRRLYPVQVAQKRRCRLRVAVRAAGGHAASPRPGGVADQLAAVLSGLGRRRAPTHVTAPVAHMVGAMAAGLPALQRHALELLLRPRATDLTLRLAGAQAQDLDPLFRNTAAVTAVHAGDAPNVLPTEGSIDLDGRLLPGFEPVQLVDELRRAVPPGVEIDVVHADPAPRRNRADLSLLPMLSETLREDDPEGHPFPVVAAGMTDARFYDALGIQTYGFLPMRLPPGYMPNLLHAIDERIPATALTEGVHTLRRALERYPAATLGR